MVSKLKLKRIVSIILCTIIISSFAMPSLASAAGESKTVRVGWYESPFNMIDENGNRSGYAYEYQRKVASYTGWNYEYVEGSWVELISRFCSEQEAISQTAEDPWNQLHIAIGVAAYDPAQDSSLNDTIKRADELMYENKRIWKEQNS